MSGIESMSVWGPVQAPRQTRLHRCAGAAVRGGSQRARGDLRVIGRTGARVAVELVVQRLEATAEHRRGAALVAFAIFQRHLYQRALSLIETRAERHVQ